MSLLWTESFASFRQGGVDTQSDLEAADYIIKSEGNAEWHVASDMVVPNRYVLSPTIYDEEGGVSIGRSLPIYTAPFIVGLSVYVPAQYERPDVDSDPVLTFFSHEDASDQGGELFRLRRDLQVSQGNGDPQNIARMIPARVHYLEVRVSLGDVMVWMDDVFVLQHTDVDFSPLGWSIEVKGSGFDIGNLYALNEDSVYPNVRLGRATRVVGDRPSGDKEVDFERPVNYESNAEVASQDFVAEPPAVLQGLGLDDKDIYTANGASVEMASMIHAVSVKTRAMNADIVPRAVSGLVESEGQIDFGLSHSRFHYLEPFTDDDILCAARVPGEGVVVGTQRGQVWFSKDAERFDGLAETSDRSAVTGLTVKSNVVIAACASGKIIKGDFNQSPPHWSEIDTPAESALMAVASNDTRIIAVGENGVAVASGSGDADTWMTINTGTAQDLTGITYSGDHWVTAGSLGDGSLRVSINNGDNWLDAGIIAPSIDGPISIMTAGGRTVVMGDGGIPVASRAYATGYSSPFYAATKFGHVVEPSLCVGGAYVDGVLVVALGDGTTLVSEDTLSFQLSQKLDMEPLAMTHMDDGRILVVGQSGGMQLRAAMPAKTELPVLAGYINSFSFSVDDPKTKEQWTPLAAALSGIGIKITEAPQYGDTGNYLLTERGLRVLDEYSGKLLIEDFTK